MDDLRLEWLSTALTASIGVPESAFVALLNTDRNEDRIDDFFNARLHLSSCITTGEKPEKDELIEHLFFYATKEIVKKSREVEYQEEVTDDEEEAARDHSLGPAKRPVEAGVHTEGPQAGRRLIGQKPVLLGRREKRAPRTILRMGGANSSDPAGLKVLRVWYLRWQVLERPPA